MKRAEQQAFMEARREHVLDVLRENPQGLTITDIAAQTGLTRDAVYDDIRALRRDPDVDNIPAQSNGYNQPWLYFLTNEVEPNRWWAENRVGDQVSRFKTELGQAATLVRVTDGRSMEGRKARKIERTLEYLLKELADLEVEVAV